MAGCLCIGSAEHTQGVLMWEIQQREEGGIPFLCGTDIERANETHQWDRLILSQSTQQPFGFRHSGCSQGQNKLQSRGFLCNSPGRGCCSPSAQLCPSSSGCSSHTHRRVCAPHTHTHRHQGRVCAPRCCLLFMDVARVWMWPEGQSLVQPWRDELLGQISPVLMESPLNTH